MKNVRLQKEVKSLGKPKATFDSQFGKLNETMKEIHKKETMKEIHKKETMKEIHKKETMKEIHKKDAGLIVELADAKKSLDTESKKAAAMKTVLDTCNQKYEKYHNEMEKNRDILSGILNTKV